MDTPVVAPIGEALARAERHSPFLRRAIGANGAVVEALARGAIGEALDRADAAGAGIDDVAVALRRRRDAFALVIAIGDLGGALGFEAVVERLSDFADAALDIAIAAAFAERIGEPPRGFAVLALGKHGSRELNYSSDIDPILIFDPATMPRRERDDPGEAAVRIGRRVIELLQQRTGDGHVLRVDLRLRPSPEITPIVLPVEAAISYYESSAEPWERAAFIRARAAAGDKALGARFLEAVEPFVWRRALDFGAIAEIRGISRRIRGHFAQGQKLGPGYDLKRGRGGIREVEFFAQIHQLIHGGRDPALRAPATLDALAALAAAGRIDEAEARDLARAYRLLRTIEHRLQMVDDRQTHELPADSDALDNVARLHGAADGAALLAMLAAPVERVGAIYDALDDSEDKPMPVDGAGLEAALADAGFPDREGARARVEDWRAGKLATLRSPAAREAFEAVLPSLLAAFGAAPDPMAALNRFDMLLARLPSAVNLFRLVEARPALGELLADILSHAPTLAGSLARRAELLDRLIDASALDPPGSVEEIAERLRGGKSEDYQDRLDRVRRQVGEERFAIGVRLIEGASGALAIARDYSRVAEAALTALAEAAVAEFEASHGRVPGGELVILALGRLGGEAMTHASDLDLVYLFTGDHGAQSDGERPLGATRYFNRLAQRVTAALSVATASGPLYDVDTRLRPSGAQGLLAVSFESFAHYHRENSWTWEHMALTRARPVFGSSEARGALSAMIANVLGRPRDPAVLIADIASMRADIALHKPPAGAFDVKLIEGGLVDLEFCVHLVQLRERQGFDSRLDAALEALTGRGLLAPPMRAAHDLLTGMLVALRLIAPGLEDVPEPSRAIIARACGRADWATLLEDYAAARQCVRAEWRRLNQGEDHDRGR